MSTVKIVNLSVLKKNNINNFYIRQVSQQLHVPGNNFE